MNRKLLAFAALGVVSLIFAAAGQVERPEPKPAAFDPGKAFPVETLKADLKVLWDILEEGHGGFDRYTPVEAQRKAFEAVEKGLTQPLTEFEFYVKLLPLIAGIKDGHTQLILSVDGYPKDRGIVPEFPVTPTIEDLLAGRDPVLERALAYLGKK